MMPWALDVARRFKMEGASFFTQSCAASAIYNHYRQGLISIPYPPNKDEDAISIPSLPMLRSTDLPSLISDVSSYPALLRLLTNQFSNFMDAKWLLFNTVHKLEPAIAEWMARKWPSIKTIGPTIPSLYADKRLKNDSGYGLNLFKPNINASTKWLDSKQAKSVIYVSFGSLASLGEEQMEELAWSLDQGKSPFLWIVREEEIQKLPPGLDSEKGLVVNWCHQLEVLSHKAIGCFLTHCGWNSTLEALSLGIPLVAMPQWTDQPTNAKFVADVWGNGVRVRADEKGVVRRDEIDKCVREAMEGEEIRRNAAKLKEFVQEAVREGGSSDKNVEAFVAELLCL